MLEFLKKIAFSAGEICLAEAKRFGTDDISYKNARDLVTVVDRQVESYLVQQIGEQYPGHDIIGEESGVSSRGSRYKWIIDPIDGTTSYVHRQPFYSVSIALQCDAVTELGVVYAPALGQMFVAERGRGAWLNGQERLSVSSTDEMINALFATGFACLRAGRKPNNIIYLSEILPKIRDIRRCGSAAIDLAYVAAGKVDGFWEMDLNLYDVAAGILLIEEAGGKVVDMAGGGAYPERGIAATNGKLTEDLLALFRRAEEAIETG